MTARFITRGLLVTLAGALALGCGQEAAGPSGAEVLWEDAYSPTGSLVVAQDGDGRLDVLLRGKIGVDSPEVARVASAATTLADTYLALHPGVPAVPADVRALSDRLVAQRKAELAGLTPVEQAARPAPAQQPEDEAAFDAEACQSFSGGFSGYTPKYCSYQYNWHAICTYSTVATNDRSYAWNESPYAGYQTLSGMTWMPAIPAWTWQWATWGGSYTNRYACLYLDGSNTFGNVGITDHGFWTDESLHPVSGD
ncbi:MAG TPA: hypothetical protein VN853_16920 [Polyangia bacterium]|jgi:hypothetical protein|nr:hypothetical protein [Polyangia bacterium]